MVQRGNGLRLAVEPLLHLRVFGELRGQHLDRDRPVQPRVGSLVDFAHSARTRGRKDLVRTERDSWLERHRAAAIIRSSSSAARPNTSQFRPLVTSLRAVARRALRNHVGPTRYTAQMRRSLPLAVLVALVSCSSPPPSPKSAPVDFNKLTDDFMYGELALTPVSATQAGYHEHNGMPLDEALDDYSAAAIEAQRRFYQSIQERVAAIDAHALDGEQQADLKITARFPTLNIPSKGPERPTQILIVLQLHLVASQAGVWDIDVSVRPNSRPDFQHELPLARLAAVEHTCRALVSCFNPKARYETSDLATLQPRGPLMLHEVQSKQAATPRDRTLNHFAIASNVAI